MITKEHPHKELINWYMDDETNQVEYLVNFNNGNTVDGYWSIENYPTWDVCTQYRKVEKLKPTPRKNAKVAKAFATNTEVEVEIKQTHISGESHWISLNSDLVLINAINGSALRLKDTSLDKLVDSVLENPDLVERLKHILK